MNSIQMLKVSIFKACMGPGKLESPAKRPLVLESSGNLLTSTKNMKSMEGSKEN